MLFKLFRKYNQNRRSIWAVIFMIAFFVILLHVIFGIIRESNQREYESLYNVYHVNQTNIVNTENGNENKNQEIIGLEGNQSNISSEDIFSNSSSSTNSSSNLSNNSVIQDFVSLCNENKIQEAYNMLSKSCQQALFPTVNDFKQNYVDKIFEQEKTAKIEQSYYGYNVFKVTYQNNLLSSGGKIDQNTKQDYIYVAKEEEEYKISVNKYINTTELKKTSKYGDITIIISKKITYLDYEEYQIQIFNDSDKTICLPSESDKVYLIDNENIKYRSNISNLSEKLISPQDIIIANVLFYKTYNTERISQNIIFQDIISNYDDYLNGKEKEMTTISINL